MQMRSWLVCGMLVGCDPAVVEPDPPADDTDVVPTAPDEEPDVVPLSDVDRLVRAAMALNGTRPTNDDIVAVQADPAALEGIVDRYLDDPRFGETVRDVENQSLLVRIERALQLPDGLGVSTGNFVAELFEEPLRLIEHVVMNDQPYTETVTMQGTVVSALGTVMWAGIADTHDPTGPAYQFAEYTDGRPMAGVLSTAGFQTRVAANLLNAHRQGAAAAAAALICTDYLSRDVNLGSVDLTDEDAIDQAILVEPACVSCHQTLDPLGGFLWGFANRGVLGGGNWPLDEWAPPNPDQAVRQTGRAPGYFGLGGDTLTDIGPMIAADHRFSACTARRYISWLRQVDVVDVPIASVDAAQTALLDSGFDLKAMVKQIVLSDAFAASHAADEGDAEQVVGYLHTRPEQMRRLIEDLTGFVWTTQDGPPPRGFTLDLLHRSAEGFKVHGGGIDSQTKLTPVFNYSATMSAYLRNLAAEAAGFVVENDFAAAAADRKLLALVEADTTDEQAVRDQLAALHLRVLAEVVAPDSPEVDATYALFVAAVDQTPDVSTAWKVVLTALLQDFRIAYH